MNYQDYINSYEWKILSEQIKIDRGYRCQLCNVSGYVSLLHVHHNNYERIGKEFDRDLVVLCDDCHKLFHDNKKPSKNRIELSKEKIREILHFNKISACQPETNPWINYEKGKSIIQHIIDGINAEFYDKYNSVNVDIVDNAISYQKKLEFENAKNSENWNGCWDEHSWRIENDYWEGWRNG